MEPDPAKLRIQLRATLSSLRQRVLCRWHDIRLRPGPGYRHAEFLENVRRHLQVGQARPDTQRLGLGPLGAGSADDEYRVQRTDQLVSAYHSPQRLQQPRR